MWHRFGPWFRFFGPFGFGFSVGFPSGMWDVPSVEEELQMLKEYKEFLERELEKVNERIRRLEGK